MEWDIAPAIVARLRERAAHDQYDAAMQDYLDSDDEYRRWCLIGLLVGHAPTESDWQHYEALRTEFKHSMDTNLTTGDIAQLTGLPAATIRQMSERGEMPAPRHRGRWWWWNENEITEWLVQRSLP